MYFNPDRMDDRYQTRISDWLEANGCRDFIALEPIVVRGQIAEYTSLGRKYRIDRDPIDWERGLLPWARRKKIRLRIPLSRIPIA